ncbi:DUF2975 domain-containing protein [Actinoplanes regularis]|uniref:DUF2975 domain-containing protein n=1 Tax=Actinoplanes regularis TaxID=52697 RepID=A0A239G088_9ACTN|nr:DUF2975 domain-containing protein [Actinoplanes regularis]GIE90076.1 hypothetical protein Are01nite_65560 [Actinoplanes regularis]SNS61952.1 Protein of unknown function [Actinoplanes regularis]
MRLIDNLRRPDWLDELHSLLLFAVTGTGLAVVGGVIATLSGRALEVDVASDGALRPDALVGAPPGVSLGNVLHLRVEDPDGAQLTWAILTTLPRQLLILAALVLLWRSVGRARREDPFGPGMAGGFRRLGLLLVVGGPVVWVVEFVARFALSGTAGVGGTYASMDFLVPFAWLFCGFGAFAIGEVLRRGRMLRAELDGVV